jgi:MerR family transcriptional regulator, light-induced transcriptional regulator
MDRMSQPISLLSVASDDCELPSLPFDLSDVGDQQTPTAHERISHIVRTIEADIIPRLVRAHLPSSSTPREPLATLDAQPTDAEVLHFVELVLDGHEAGYTELIDRLRARSVAVETVYLGLLTPAAHELGRRWEEDLTSFSDVTVAVGRLQRLMRGLSQSFGSEADTPADGRRILLIPAPGEQHTFGLSIVAEFFRRAGWEVVGADGEEGLEAAAVVRSEWYDVVGISVGVEARLDWLRSGISALRAASRNRAIGVLVGGPVFALRPERVAEVGADATAPDGRQAPDVAEGLLGSRARRL